jgi:thiol-disulfide isomerase/thioredoxin
VVVRVIVLGLIVVAATAAGLIMRARAGRVRVVEHGERLRAAEIGAGLGERATFVQFSSPACSSCGGVRRVLGDLADGAAVTHVEIDATERLDLARRLRIMRTPTVLVLDRGGAVVRRVSGPMTPVQARAALPDPVRS